MGVGFSAWQDGVDINGVVSTGEIDPVFTLCEVAGESRAPGIAMVMPEDGGKRLGIYIQGAYPGYFAHFRYRISNLGTVPVCYETEVHGNTQAFDMDLSAPQGVICGQGDSGEGDLWLTVGNVEENSDYNFTVDLVFRQWNAVK
jgi:hypothetical protein